ncbi:MAG: FecR family protein [Niabella sp.]
MPNNIENRIYDLLSRKLSGDADDESLKELNSLLKKYPDYQFLNDQLTLLDDKEVVLEDIYTSQAYAAHSVKMLQSNTRIKDYKTVEDMPMPKASSIKKYFYAVTAIAAVFAAFIVLKSWYLKLTNTTNESHIVAQGTKSKVVLPDGTTVYLNAGSEINYAKDFGIKDRQVTLTGEAYFDVVHNPAKKFIVHTALADVAVHGTTFNVKNYDNDNWETTLLSGKVEVILNKQSKERFVLQPAQKLSVKKADNNPDVQSNKKSSEEIVISKITTLETEVAEISWMNNKMVFVDEPLYKIAEELERAFHIKVLFKSSAVKQYRYTGVFGNQDLMQILKILDMSRPFNYQLIGAELHIE